MFVKQQRLDVQKLFRFTGAANQTQLGEMVGVPERSVANWIKNGGVPDITADTVAIRLGVHPSAIWGDAWFALAEQPVVV
jgi:plasmid maintenance system antidote protein VapI